MTVHSSIVALYLMHNQLCIPYGLQSGSFHAHRDGISRLVQTLKQPCTCHWKPTYKHAAALQPPLLLFTALKKYTGCTQDTNMYFAHLSQMPPAPLPAAHVLEPSSVCLHAPATVVACLPSCCC